MGTTNKGHPFEYREFDKEGRVTIQDYSKQTIENFNKLKLDCLFVVGGDGTLQIAHRFCELGLPVIGIPKTIDNDLVGTDYTFDYQTSVQVACDRSVAYNRRKPSTCDDPRGNGPGCRMDCT